METFFGRFRPVLFCVALLALTSFVGAQQPGGQPPPPHSSAGASAPPPAAEASTPPPDAGDDAKKKTTSGPVTLNFVDMDLSEVITNISKITGKNFLWDQKVQGKVTIVSPEGIRVDEAWKVFEAVMRFNGFQLVPIKGVRNLYKIVRVQDIAGETIPTYTEGTVGPATESFITRLLPLRYIDAQSAAAVLTNLKSQEGKIIPYPPTNTLIIIESSNNLNRLIQILRQMDVPVKLPQIKIVRVKYATADQLAGELTQLLSQELLGALMGPGGDDEAAAAQPQPGATEPPRPSAQRRRPDAANSQGKTSSGVKLIPDMRTNSLIIVATEEIMDEVLRVINELDIPVEGEEGIYVYYCKNAKAQDLASTLSSLSGSGSSSARQPNTAAPQVGGVNSMAPERVNTARTPQTQQVVSGQINMGKLSGEARITADEATNSLVIVANRRDYGILLQVIEKLDVRRRQVFVEAVILEIELSNSGSAGSSFTVAGAIENQAAVFGGSALGGLNSLSILSALTSSTATNILPGGFSVGALSKTISLDVGGTKVTIPAFSALFNALMATNNVNVLSTPNLLTTDNEAAEIIVGQNVPIPTGSTTSTGGQTTTTIERQNVGIKLKVTPQISESGTVYMQIFTEISGVVTTSVAGIDVNTLGVTTSVKSAETNVLVDNHQTVVIGGLIENRVSDSTYKVPFLGDIPLLGWLFKYKTKQTQKTNLVILLTPHIVSNGAEIEDISQRYNRRRIKFLDDATGGRYHEPFYMEPLLLPEELATPEAGFAPTPNPEPLQPAPMTP